MSGAVARGCLESSFLNVKEYFNNPFSRTAKAFQSSEFRDKLLKCAKEGLLPAATEIARLAGASDKALQGIESGRTWVSGARDGYAIFNIFAGVMAAVVVNVLTFKALVKGFYNGDREVPLKTSKERALKSGTIREADSNTRDPIKSGEVFYEEKLPHYAKAVGPFEQLLAMGSNLGKGVAAAAYTVGFGVCRPIANLHKHIKDSSGKPVIPMGETTLQIGEAFERVMMVNHCAGLFGSACELGFQYKAKNRALEAKEDAKIVYHDYMKKMIENSVGFAEKFLESGMDVVNLCTKMAPVWVRIPAGLTIGILGVTKEWLKAE